MGADYSLNFPERKQGAMGGGAFIATILDVPMIQAREDAIYNQVELGNIPDFMRSLCPVMTSVVAMSGATWTGTYYVTPDYLCIGSDDDFVRVPMNPLTAQKIADLVGGILPTRRIVNDVFSNGTVRLRPQPIPPDDKMSSTRTFLRHHNMIEGQRVDAPPGELTVGHKKDIVLCLALPQHPDRVAIYGWHNTNGVPIQDLNCKSHSNIYSDYSHGLRLVSGTMSVNGKRMETAEVLQAPGGLAGLISDEGALKQVRYG